MRQRLEDKYKPMTEEQMQREREVMEAWDERCDRVPVMRPCGAGYKNELDAYRL